MYVCRVEQLSPLHHTRTTFRDENVHPIQRHKVKKSALQAAAPASELAAAAGTAAAQQCLVLQAVNIVPGIILKYIRYNMYQACKCQREYLFTFVPGIHSYFLHTRTRYEYILLLYVCTPGVQLKCCSGYIRRTRSRVTIQWEIVGTISGLVATDPLLSTGFPRFRLVPIRANSRRPA